MKKLFLALCFCTGTAQAMTYDELAKFSERVSLADCPRIDRVINQLEDQLKRRGLFDAEPESLREADRQYNALSRIIIWNLRIGCSDPHRYRR